MIPGPPTNDAIPPDPRPTAVWPRRLLFLALLAAVVAFHLWGPDEATVVARSGEWRGAAREHLVLAALTFFSVEVVLVGCSLPVGGWLSVLAGFLFGTLLGAAVVNLASTAGAVLAFLAARYLFFDRLHAEAAARPRLGRAVARIDRGFRAHGAYYVVLLRLTPVVPFWLINLGAALTPVRVRDFWWATQFGMLPLTLLFCHAGAGLVEVKSARDALSREVVGALALATVLPVAIHWLARRRLSAAAA